MDNRHRFIAIFAVVVLAGHASDVDVLTYHNDVARGGLNSDETILTPATLRSHRFSKVFDLQVDGSVYAQPLIISRTAKRPNSHMAIVATCHDSVYAFDADAGGPPLWQTSFLAPGIKPVPPDVVSSDVFEGEIGIVSTPAIDKVTESIYVVSYTYENEQCVYRLHALDVATGMEKLGGPTVLAARVPGLGDNSDGEFVTFDSMRHLQRSALLLANGQVYIAFASHGDITPYHGWVLAYDAGTLQQTAVFNATPNGTAAGIWMSGCGPAADADGNIYVSTGNGTFSAANGGADFGDSIVKLSPSLQVLDWFSPYNTYELGATDFDLGSSGVILLPDQNSSFTHLAITGGKEGTLYTLNRDDLGKFNPVDDSQIPSALYQVTGGVFGVPAYWNERVFVSGVFANLRAYSLDYGVPDRFYVAQSENVFGYPEGTPSLSCNPKGDNALAWMIEYPDVPTANATLLAYNANQLGEELFSSADNPKDAAGPAIKFTVPTVANGFVYVGCQSEVAVYGFPARARLARRKRRDATIYNYPLKQQ